MKPGTRAPDILALLAALGLLLWFLSFAYTAKPFLAALAISLAFTALAFWLRAVDLSGAFAGAIVAFLFYAVGGLPLFGCLFLVFVLTWAATLSGRSKKQALGVAERSRGRSASQVMANLFVATFCVVFDQISTANGLFLACALAAVAEAAADTVSSEIGEAFGGVPRLLTTFAGVPPGTNGGITLIGSFAGVVAASVIAFAGVALRGGSLMAMAVIAATIGMFVDSLLGAVFENRGLLNNDAVNLIGTASAAGVLLLVGPRL
jgi:uncharacterized protein (TIGR00297 family)